MMRAIGFVVASMVAGFLSGILAPHVFGVRGAILGGALAGGVLACDAYQKRKEALPVTVVVGIAAAVSLSTFLLVFGWGAVVRICFPDEITEPMLQTTWHGILTSFLISLGVLLYCKTHLLRYLFWMPLLSVLPRAIALEPGIRSGELPLGVLPIFLFCSVAGLFPFLLLWCGVARLYRKRVCA